MEAAEKAQLPLDRPPAQGDGIVRALDDRLVIERLTVDDERAARVVRERAKSGQPPAETVTKAIEIGARVVDSEGTAANVDYVRGELERGVGKLEKQLSALLESGDEALAQRLATTFDGSRDSSVQQQMRELLIRALNEQRASIAQLFAADDGKNPLADFKASVVRALQDYRGSQQRENEGNRKRIEELTQQIIELKERDAANRRIAEAEEVGTRKGRSFEELVYSELDRIASERGDAAHAVGDALSEAGGKKGDVVIEIDAASGPPAGRIVFEAKNKKLSKNDAWAELNAAMAERDASFAVLVVAGPEKIPSGTEEVAEYQGNKMIVALDHEDPDSVGLAYAYRYARARALMAGQLDLAVDAAGVRDSAERAVAALKRANSIRKALSGVTKGAETARGQLDEMIAEVERCLERIESLIAEADEPA